jgi:hypothetical protein
MKSTVRSLPIDPIDKVGISFYNLATSKLIDVIEKRWIDSSLVGKQVITVKLTDLKTKAPQVDVSYVCDNPCDRDYRLQIYGQIRVALTNVAELLRSYASRQDDRLSATIIIKMCDFGKVSVEESDVCPSKVDTYTLISNGVRSKVTNFQNRGVVVEMADRVVIQHIKQFGALPFDPIVHRFEKLECQCGHPMFLVCDSSEKFHPAYHFCPDCKAITRLGMPSWHCDSIGCPSNKAFCVCTCSGCKPRGIDQF